MLSLLSAGDNVLIQSCLYGEAGKILFALIIMIQGWLRRVSCSPLQTAHARSTAAWLPEGSGSFLAHSLQLVDHSRWLSTAQERSTSAVNHLVHTGGTYTLTHDLLPSMGITVTELQGDTPSTGDESGRTNWDALVQPNTKVGWSHAASLIVVLSLRIFHSLKT